MDLWIRSQDKMDMVKVNDIHIGEIPSSTEVEIIGYYYDKSYTTLGYYKSKERALEVLDEIQKILEPIYLLRFDNDVSEIAKLYGIENKTYIKANDNALSVNTSGTYVYEMPKE